jgi:hypothetical protein
MDKAKRARTAETPKQPSPGLQLRAPYLYPDLQSQPTQSARRQTQDEQLSVTTTNRQAAAAD